MMQNEARPLPATKIFIWQPAYKAYREETLFENLNQVKSCENTNLTDFVFSLWKKNIGGA